MDILQTLGIATHRAEYEYYQQKAETAKTAELTTPSKRTIWQRSEADKAASAAHARYLIALGDAQAMLRDAISAAEQAKQDALTAYVEAERATESDPRVDEIEAGLRELADGLAARGADLRQLQADQQAVDAAIAAISFTPVFT